MAFGQINTGFKAGIGNSPFGTGFGGGFSTGFNAPTSTNTAKTKQDNTYNPRYPGFDEEDYKRLVQIVQSQGVTGSKFDQLMDEAYQYYYPQVLNKHKLADRGEQLNQAVYENGDALLNGEGDANEKFKLTSLAQKAKEKYGIPYDYPDDQLIKSIVEGTENGNELLYNYINKGDDELLYKAGIYDQKQGGIKSLVNPAAEGGIMPEKNERRNPIGATTETVDNAAGKFADAIMVNGTKSAENLKQKLENMSPEEIEAYRKEFRKAVGEKRMGTAYTYGDTVVERLWNGIKGEKYYPEDDEAFYKWLIDKKMNLGQSLIGADDILKGESNPNVVRFFSNIPGSAVKTFTATVRGMTNPLDTLKGLYKLAATEEGHQAILQRYGSWDALANAMNTDPVGVADDVLAVAELGANIIGGGMKATGKLTGNADLVTRGGQWQGAIGSANDALAQKSIGKLYGGMDSLAGMTDNKLVQGANRYLQDASSIQQTVGDVKKVGGAVVDSAAGQAIRNWKDEMIDKIVGIDEKDRDFIQNNKEIVNEYLDGKRTVETVFDEVKEKISDKRIENTEMGKEYGNLRKNKSKVVNTEGITNDLKKTLKKQGITIKDGELEFSDMSKFNAKQKAALIDAWNELKMVESKKKINAGNVLDMRQKFDDKLDWDGKAVDLKGDTSAVNKATEGLIKDMRGAIDNRAKASVPGLKELDAKYSESLGMIQEIKKDWLNSNGTIKDNARSKLRNMTKAGNEAKLERLEKLVPGITNDLKALDVGLTVEKVTKPSVGLYSKGQRIGGGLIGAGATGNIPALLAGIGLSILTTPKNFVRVVEAYPDIVSKLQAGQELLPSDMAKLQSLASRLQDGMEE